VTRLRAALAALALVATVLVGGCAQTPETTAVINGVVIRESAVEDMTQALISTGAVASYKDARAEAAQNLISGEVGRQVALQDGIALTAADIATLTADHPTYATFFTTPVGEQFAADYTNAVQVSTTSGVDWQTEFAAVPVQLNPRYGSWPDYVADLSSSAGSAVSTGSMSAVSGS